MVGDSRGVMEVYRVRYALENRNAVVLSPSRLCVFRCCTHGCDAVRCVAVSADGLNAYTGVSPIGQWRALRCAVLLQ